MNITEIILTKKTNAELKGRPFVIIGNSTGHGFSLGEKVRYDGKDGRYLIMKNEGGGRATVDKADVQFESENLDDLKTLSKEAEEQALTFKEYMIFIEETKSNSLDEIAFKVWKIMKIFKENEEEAAKTAIYTFLKS